MSKPPTVDILMFEVSESPITLRNEEWMNIVCALELQRGGSCQAPGPEMLDRLIKRIFEQLLHGPEGKPEDGEVDV